MAEQSAYVDYRAGGDTGQNDELSIQPVKTQEGATQQTFRRAPENLRMRTERIREHLQDLFYYRDFGQTILELSPGATIAWGGLVSDGGTGIVTCTGTLKISPLLAPAAPVRGNATIGVAGTNQVQYAVPPSAYLAKDLSGITVEHRGAEGQALAATISAGPIKRILLQFDPTKLAHTPSAAKTALDAAVAADADLAGKLTITASGTGILAISAELPFSQSIDDESHWVAGTLITNLTTSRKLAAGDGVAIWYKYRIEPTDDPTDPKGAVAGGRAESAISRNNHNIPAGALFVTSDNIAKIPGALPIFRIGLHGQLILADGTRVAKGESTALTSEATSIKNVVNPSISQALSDFNTNTVTPERNNALAAYNTSTIIPQRDTAINNALAAYNTGTIIPQRTAALSAYNTGTIIPERNTALSNYNNSTIKPERDAAIAAALGGAAAPLASPTVNGLLASGDFNKLQKLAADANAAYAAAGHTHPLATESAAGLMSAADFVEVQRNTLIYPDSPTLHRAWQPHLDTLAASDMGLDIRILAGQTETRDASAWNRWTMTQRIAYVTNDNVQGVYTGIKTFKTHQFRQAPFRFMTRIAWSSNLPHMLFVGITEGGTIIHGLTPWMVQKHTFGLYREPAVGAPYYFITNGPTAQLMLPISGLNDNIAGAGLDLIMGSNGNSIFLSWKDLNSVAPDWPNTVTQTDPNYMPGMGNTWLWPVMFASTWDNTSRAILEIGYTAIEGA